MEERQLGGKKYSLLLMGNTKYIFSFFDGFTLVHLNFQSAAFFNYILEANLTSKV